MWKPEHRAAADRRGLRYPSDLTDAEWALVEPMIPPAKHGGRHREGKRPVTLSITHNFGSDYGPERDVGQAR